LAEAVAPESRVVYVDNDPIVLAHARALAEMGRRLNQAMTQQFTMRSRAQVTRFFDGLTLLDPGVVLTHERRPDSEAEAATPGVLWAGAARNGCGGLARLPARRRGLRAGARRHEAFCGIPAL
jgi:hypothetical protein